MGVWKSHLVTTILEAIEGWIEGLMMDVNVDVGRMLVKGLRMQMTTGNPETGILVPEGVNGENVNGNVRTRVAEAHDGKLGIAVMRSVGVGNKVEAEYSGNEGCLCPTATVAPVGRLSGTTWRRSDRTSRPHWALWKIWLLQAPSLMCYGGACSCSGCPLRRAAAAAAAA